MVQRNVPSYLALLWGGPVKLQAEALLPGHSLLCFQTDCAACNLMRIKCGSLCSAAGTSHRCISSCDLIGESQLQSLDV